MTEAAGVHQEVELPADLERNVEQAVRALLKLVEIKKKEGNKSGKRDLLADDEVMPVYVQLSLKHIPEVRGGIALRSKQLTVSSLPNSWYNDSLNVCLIVADVPGSKSDREKTVKKWKELLEASAIKNVNQLISARSLRTDYHTFEARRHLASAFDTFLVDKRLRMRSQEWLGSSFFSHGRIPICIRLDKRVENDEETERGLAQILGRAAESESESERKHWLQDEFARAFRTTTLSLSVRGPCSNALIGYTAMQEQELVQNAAAFFRSVIQRLPGGLANVRVAHLKCKQTRAVPFYYATTSNLSEEALSSVRRYEQKLTNRAAFRTLRLAANAGVAKRPQSKPKSQKRWSNGKSAHQRTRSTKTLKATKRGVTSTPAAKKRKV